MVNKALFIRKAVDLDKIRRMSGKEQDKTFFVIEKVIELSDVEYTHFTKNLLDDFDFIEANIDLMYVDTNQVKHCILVREAGKTSGVLVESEGYSYARYAAHYDK